MQENIFKDVSDWFQVSVSDVGDAVIGFDSADRFITAKVKAIKDVNIVMDQLFTSFTTELIDTGVTITKIDNETEQINGTLWFHRKYTITGKQVKFAWYSCALLDGYYCVLESMFESLNDVLWFKQQFIHLVSNIRFEELHREVGVLQYADYSIEAIGVSDVLISHQKSNNSILFVSNNKYFAVTISEVSQRDTLLEAVSDSEFKEVLCDTSESELNEKFFIYHDDEITGTVELHSIVQNNCFIEVLGYWNGYTDASITDNLILNFKKGAA